MKDRSLTQLDMPVGDILRIQAAEVCTYFQRNLVCFGFPVSIFDLLVMW